MAVRELTRFQPRVETLKFGEMPDPIKFLDYYTFISTQANKGLAGGLYLQPTSEHGAKIYLAAGLQIDDTGVIREFITPEGAYCVLQKLVDHAIRTGDDQVFEHVSLILQGVGFVWA